METVLVMATTADEAETVELTGAALDARGVGPAATEVYATTDGRFALVRWAAGAERPRLIRAFPRLEAATAMNAALHGVNPVAVAREKVDAKRRGKRS